KCILPEVEVFLGEVPMAMYETPGTQKFAETIVPYVKDCNTIILANHGTVSFGLDLEKAYFNTEIIDAYCRILILARQLGPVNFFTDPQAREVLDLKKRLGYDDPRLRCENCDLCGNSVFDRGYSAFTPQAKAFKRDPQQAEHNPAPNGDPAEPDMEHLVQTVTDQVMKALAG